jgi:non-specific protein-tyrosine kinase
VTKKQHFKGSCDALSAVGSSVLGVVLNKIPDSKLEYEYGYRYGHGRYYGSNYGPSVGSSSGKMYAPSEVDLARFEQEDTFEFIKGKRFKEELMRQARSNT